jgi:hypothetical protein
VYSDVICFESVIDLSRINDYILVTDFFSFHVIL